MFTLLAFDSSLDLLGSLIFLASLITRMSRLLRYLDLSRSLFQYTLLQILPLLFLSRLLHLFYIDTVHLLLLFAYLAPLVYLIIEIWYIIEIIMDGATGQG